MVEVPRLVQRLREVFSSNAIGSQQNEISEPPENRESLDSPPPASQSFPEKEKKLTRRTGWYVISKSFLSNWLCLWGIAPPKQKEKTYISLGNLPGTFVNPPLR